MVGSVWVIVWCGNRDRPERTGICRPTMFPGVGSKLRKVQEGPSLEFLIDQGRRWRATPHSAEDDEFLVLDEDAGRN